MSSRHTLMAVARGGAVAEGGSAADIVLCCSATKMMMRITMPGGEPDLVQELGPGMVLRGERSMAVEGTRLVTREEVGEDIALTAEAASTAKSRPPAEDTDMVGQSPATNRALGHIQAVVKT